MVSFEAPNADRSSYFLRQLGDPSCANHLLTTRLSTKLFSTFCFVMPKLSAYVRRSREEKPCAGYGLHDAPASCLQDDKVPSAEPAAYHAAAPRPPHTLTMFSEAQRQTRYDELEISQRGLNIFASDVMQIFHVILRLRANKTSAAPKVYRQPDGTLGDTKPPNTSRSQVSPY